MAKIKTCDCSFGYIGCNGECRTPGRYSIKLVFKAKFLIERVLEVQDDNGHTRRALFNTWEDAVECCRVTDELMKHSPFYHGCSVIPECYNNG